MEGRRFGVVNFDWTVSLPLLLAVGSFLYTHYRTRTRSLDQRDEEGAHRLDRHDSRLQSLEEKLAAMPGKEDLHQLHLDIARISGAISRMEAVTEGNAKIMERLERIVSRHEDHLLNGVKK
jgi:hypothetical protein